MQEPELFEYEEQEDHDRASGIQEILPELPEASASPRNQVNCE
jgi:hypothetical protein